MSSADILSLQDNLKLPPIPDDILVAPVAIPLDVPSNSAICPTVDGTILTSLASIRQDSDPNRDDDGDFKLDSALTDLPEQSESTLYSPFINGYERASDEIACSALVQPLSSVSPENVDAVLAAVTKSRRKRFGKKEEAIGSEHFVGEESECHILHPPNLERSVRETWATLQIQHATSLLKQAERSNGFTLLNAGIGALTDTARYLSKDSHLMLPLLDNLSVALQTRFHRLGEANDLHRAILLEQHAVDLAYGGDPDEPTRLGSLGTMFLNRFERFGSLRDLGQAIYLIHRAVELTPDDHSTKPGNLNNLGNALELRFIRIGNPGDLDRAVLLNHRAVELAPESHPNKPLTINNLGNTLETRFDRLGNLEDLEQSIFLRHRAVELTPDDHPHKSGFLNNLGNALGKRFDHLGELRDLEQAISLKLDAVELTLDNHPNKPAMLDNLGDALKTRFHRLGDIDDLKQAISLKHYAAELTPDDRPDKPGRFNILGDVLNARFHRFGELEDLEKAIFLKCRAIMLVPDNHPFRPTWFINLGHALEMRFDRLRNIEDLEQAISLKYRAVELTLDDHPIKPGMLISLGRSLEARFDHLRDPEDIEHAISLMRLATELMPNNHPDKPGRLSNLARVLRTRSMRRLLEPGGLESTTVLIHRAVEPTSNNHSSNPVLLHGLGRVPTLQFFQAFFGYGELEDLQEATSLLRQAGALTPADHPRKLHLLVELAHTDLLCFYSFGGQDSLFSALERFFTVLTSTLGLVSERFGVARPMAITLRLCAILSAIRVLDGAPRYYHDQLMDMYQYAFTLIPEAVWLGSSVTRRFEVLRDIGEFTRGAAATAIEVSELTIAIEWLEQGRSVVWGQLLQLRSPMDELQVKHPHLASRLRDISLELERSANIAEEAYSHDAYTYAGATLSNANARDKIAARLQLATEYHDLLSRIRELERFENFLIPKKFGDVTGILDSSVDCDSVVLINVHRDRCDALVCISGDRIIPVPLPDLTEEIAERLLEQFNDLVHVSGIRKRETVARSSGVLSDSETWDDSELEQRASRGAVRDEADRSLMDVLYALWIFAIHPILQVIQREFRDTAEGLLHVTWCPTGPLASLPIHAAGEYKSGSVGGPKLFDSVVSSYAPNLSSLLKRPAYLPGRRSLASPAILAVSQPETPGQPPLPATVKEMDILKHYFSGEIVHLNGADATIDAVLRAMDEYQCPYLHFACHEIQDPDNPRKSAFTLYDGNLDLGQLMSKSSSQAT